MARFLLFFIPILTFLVPARWFGFYAALMFSGMIYMVVMFTLLPGQSAEAFADFGIDMVAAYMLLNLVLLAVRRHLIRRGRERITKLPAPKE
jgi:hypothetical protein